MHETVTLADSPVPAGAARRGRVAALLELSKARLCALVVLTAAIGLYLAPAADAPITLTLALLAGTTLSAFGANALNQCIEVARDAQMERTRRRPLPSGELSPAFAWSYALTVSVAGPVILALFTNALTAILAAGCILLYVCVYTPMKVRSPLNTLVGAVCGAIPPVMGWTAVTGDVGPGAWILGTILFVWQIPHFLALAWMYRDDYARGGFRMLPNVDAGGERTCQAILLYALALAPVTLGLSMAGVTDWLFAAGALLLGLAFSATAVRMYRKRNRDAARRVFLASVMYLPLLMGLMVVDRAVSPSIDGRSGAVVASAAPALLADDR